MRSESVVTTEYGSAAAKKHDKETLIQLKNT
jgi:hypothetical protein